MMLFFRIIVDFLWQVKAFNIILNVILLGYVVNFLLKKKSGNATGAYIILFILFIINLRAYSLDVNDTSTNLFFKISFSFLLFFVGVNTRKIFHDSKLIGKLSICLVLAETILAVLHLGYQYWGDVYTFSGFYYFKTDLALAIAISVVYILYFTETKKYQKILLCLFSIYLIYLSNARAHLVTVFIVLALYLFGNAVIKNAKAFLLIGLPVLGCFLVITLIIISHFSTGLLTIDFNDFFSDKNLQGRNVIWEVLLKRFNDSSFYDRTFGLGLTADIKINSLFGNTEETRNAHNGFLYVLVSWGYLGCLFFLSFLILIFKRFFTLCSKYYNDVNYRNLLLMFLSNMFIFLVSSLSNVTLVFQQQTWFFLFFCGVLFNPNYFSTQERLSKQIKSGRVFSHA